MWNEYLAPCAQRPETWPAAPWGSRDVSLITTPAVIGGLAAAAAPVPPAGRMESQGEADQ